MTAYQFSQPWLNELTGKQANTAMEFAHLRTYLKGLDDGTISLFNLNAINATIGNLTVTGTGPYLLLTGGTMSGVIAMGSNKITGLANGTSANDAVNFSQYQNAQSNILINGGFEFWQRGTSFSAPANATYIADRWKVQTNDAADAVASREATTIDSGTYALKVVVSGSPASKNWYVTQFIENYSEYKGKTITFSARVKSSVANSCRLFLNDGVTTPESNIHSGGGNWETLTVSQTVSASATLLSVNIGLPDTGFMQNGTYYFDSCMLIIGSEAVTFVPMNYEIELAQCQRYYEKSYAIETSPGANTGNGLTNWVSAQIQTTNTAETGIFFRVTKRVAPTMALFADDGTSGKWTWYTAAGAGTQRTTGTTSAIFGSQIFQTVTSLELVGQGHWTADAEM